MGTKKFLVEGCSWFLVLGAWLRAALKKVLGYLFFVLGLTFLVFGYSVVAQGPAPNQEQGTKNLLQG